MARSKPFQFVLTALFLCLATSTAFLYFDNLSLRERLSQVEERSPEAKLAVEKATVTAASTEVSASVASASETEEEQVENNEGDRRDRRREQFERFMAMFDDPDRRMEMVERNLREIDRRYSKFFQRLDLEPDQIEALRVLLAERGVLQFEERAKSRFYNDSEEELALAQADLEGRSEELDGAMANVLGEGGMEKFETYTKEQPYMNRVERLETSLSYTESPISREQIDTLISAYASAGESFQYTNDLSDREALRGMSVDRDMVDTYVTEMETFDSLVLAQASEVLDETQLANLAEQQQSDRAEQERRIENRLEGGGEGRGGPGGGGRGPGGGR